MNLKLLLTSLGFLFSFHAIFAQTGHVSGQLLDSANHPVSYATVAIFDTRDSSVINFCLSDDQGEFELRGIPIGIPARLLVSHLLYQSILKDFKVDTSGVFEMDGIHLKEKQNELTETVVTWEAPPIVIRNDTVEFNADAFIGRPGSVVEDLLKRIPGIVIDANGNITYNGTAVSKITIDSKDFFANDPVILLKNIPAKAIEKVQVSREKDDRGLETQTGAVSINLTLKHWAKKSHFGKAYAGTGTTGRYEAGGLWNLMRDTLQISLIGFGNNLSQSGFSFSELYQMGGFNRSGINRMAIYEDGRMEMNGLNMGGGEGITTTGALGFNVNYDIPKKLKLNTNYFFGLNSTSAIKQDISQRYFGDSTLNFTMNSQNLLKNSSHHASVRVKFTPDTVQIITINPQFEYSGYNNQVLKDNQNRYEGDSSHTDINNQNIVNYANYSWSNMASYDWKVRKNQIYVKSSAGQSFGTGTGTNQFLTSNYLDSLFLQSQTNQVQARSTNINSTELNHTISYSRSPNDSTRFTLGVSNEYQKGLQNIAVNDRDSLGNLNFLNYLSTQFHYTINQLSLNTGIYIRRKNSRLWGSADLSLADYNLLNQLSSKSVQNRFYLFESQLYYILKDKNSNQLVVNYNLDQTMPYYWQMIDLTNNSDPNRITRGNPDLRPYLNNSLSMRYSWKDKSGKTSLYPSISASQENRAIVNALSYDEAGRSVSQPVNLDPAY
ncbi:MAG: outer membrane beta-barrel protein [Bacteroidetes bacterium]|nr:outer membrane beta-barrel protein [Bacteroidota bacterium]